jgi:hypothetical protein
MSTAKSPKTVFGDRGRDGVGRWTNRLLNATTLVGGGHDLRRTAAGIMASGHDESIFPYAWDRQMAAQRVTPARRGPRGRTAGDLGQGLGFGHRSALDARRPSVSSKNTQSAPSAGRSMCDSVAISLQADGERWSGCRDSNPGPPDPQSGALARLRYIPFVLLNLTPNSSDALHSVRGASCRAMASRG